ncbi:non-ribosomal peptide synthetase [Flavobacterium sp. '19STA2R22 D10 B1']|uniref:non-ribosomal peptide synthetase n=1 Tax=Flavobacterium aerium TaxID=3037261 RepID=UPI00278C6269|nr:non-ribosomal peptide synthetase [Flavobacterium sp. '19STA2R22 D10 B1']
MNKKVIHTVFENVAMSHGTNIAIETENTKISYRQFNEEANKIAHLLYQKGYNNESRIAVFCEDAVAQLIALMGVFKSGNIYVPLSVKYKENHWDVLFNKVQPNALIITKDNLSVFEKFNKLFDYTIPELIVVCINNKNEILCISQKYENGIYTEDNTVIKENTTNLIVDIDENGANYIFFTSGSTGKPKAVLGQHKSLSHFIHWEAKELDIDSTSRIGQLTSFSFDASLRDIFLPLLKGGCICLPSKGTSENTTKLCEWFIEKQITILHTVPTMMRSILKAFDKKSSTQNYFKDLQYLLLAGEKLYVKDIVNWREKFGENTCIINLYGATESTLVKTFYRVKDDIQNANAEELCVGKPISNTNILILNTENKICEIGEVGDIYIQTPFLTKGYYQDTELTQEKFIQNPLSEFQDIIYKTGDYGKYDTERNTIVLGRKDGIVKINGVRCDLNSIERNILEFSKIKEVKCIPYLEKGTNQLIMCFYSSPVEINEELKAYCLKTLSEYELFGLHLLYIEKFPVNANGKIDTAILNEKIAIYFQQHKEIVLPINEVEEKLSAIWKELLGVDRISTLDNIFLLGANSIQLIQIAGRIHSDLGIELTILDLFSIPVLKDLAKKISSSQTTIYYEIPKVEISENYRVSSSQFRLWILSQYEESSLAYNMPNFIIIENSFNIELFKKAIYCVIDRHEVLRTVFKEIQGELKQIIKKREELDFIIDYKDFRMLDNGEQLATAYIVDDSLIQFDFEKGPLIRMALLQLENHKYVFYYNMHHIISDGWSMNILERDVMAYYEAFISNKESKLPPLKIQYKDYALWQQKRLESETSNKGRGFWLEQLSGTLPVFSLPSNKIRPKVYTHSGHRFETCISDIATQTLKEYCKKNHGTLFVGLLAIWKILLHKYSGQEDIIIGSPVSGRDHVDLKDQIGFYVNTLALRTNIDSSKNFDLFFEAVKESTLQSFEHQTYPFDKLVEQLSVKRDMSRNPVFDVLLTLQNTGDVEENITINSELYETITDGGEELAKFDLSFHFKEVGKGLYFQITYNTDIYEPSMMIQLMNHYKNIMCNLLESPTKPINEIDYITQEEEQKIQIDFNQTASNYPRQTICSLFKSHVTTKSNELAVTDKYNGYTYQTLEVKSNQVANYIIQNYAENNNGTVAVLMDRSADLIVVLLGILKSGYSYIPLDPNFPQERLEYIVKHSEVSMILGEVRYANLVGNTSVYIPIDEVLKETNQASRIIDFSDFTKDAYIIYTSGSTGNPKGVRIGHQSLTNFLISIQQNQKVSSNDLLFSVTTQSFDISILEFFVPLISGGTVYMASKETLSDPFTIIEEIESVQPSILQATPSFYQMLFDAGWKGNEKLKILCGGDLLSKSLAEKMLSVSKEVWNMYGPTETTIWSSTKLIKEADDASNIGKPINNTKMYILDGNKKLVPEGIPGELYISGDGLSKGYVKDEVQTDEKFSIHPFIKGEKIYNTGDLGKWNSKGEIQFLGRNDFQVKIRGYRIELKEIEYCLSEHRAIKEVVVMVTQKKAEQNELIVYFVSVNNREVKINDLRKFVEKRLPGYMIPSYFIQLDKMPLTPNKKIDRKILLEIPELGVTTEKKYVSPKTETEIILVNACIEILGIPQIGLKDNFYQLGGDSIKLIRIISILRSHNYILKPKHVVTALNMRDLASHVKKYDTIPNQKKGITNTNKIKKSQNTEDSKVVEEMIFDISGNQYHLLKLNTTIGINDFSITNFNKETFEDQFREFLSYFPSLCIQLIKTEKKIQQKHISAANVNIVFSHMNESIERNIIEEQANTFFMKPFALYEEELIRVFVVNSIENKKATISLGIHHGLTDFHTNTIIRDLAIKYFEENIITEIYTPNFNFVKAQQKHLVSKEGKLQRKFWVNYHRKIASKRNLETNIQYISEFINQKVVITGQDLELLRKLSHNMKIPINGLLLALHGYVIEIFYDKKRNIQGILVNGRDQKIDDLNISNVLGVLNNILPLKITKTPENIFKLSYFKEVYSNYVEARLHQEIPFETIKKDIIEATNVNIEACLGGVFDYQKMENSYFEGENHTIEINSDTRTKQEGIYVTCFEYINALEINLSCPFDMYHKSGKETISLPKILHNYLYRIGTENR